MLVDTTATTTRIEPQASPPARELGSSGSHATAPVRLVFSLPGMKPHARLWRRGRNLAQVLWPLIAPFAPHLPREAHLQIVACSRVYRGNDGIPEILLTIDHPAVFDFSIWVRDHGEKISLRLTSVAPGMSITEIVASCFPHRRYADTLLDAVRADDHPICRNGMIVSVCDEWRRDESFPLADWHFVLCGCGMLQFPLEVPEMLMSLPAPCLDSSHPQHLQIEEMCRQRFMSQFMHSCARHIKWLCESVTDKHIRVILPGRGMCRLKWQHRIAPTAEGLRPTIAEIWPDLSLYAILDTFSFQQDACIFLVQGSARLYTAWLLMDPFGAATDVRLVPCGFHPVSCLPTPPGTHAAILQSHGAWGIFRFAPGEAPSVPRTPHHSATIIAWEHAAHDSSDSDEFRTPPYADVQSEDETVPVPVHASEAPDTVADVGMSSSTSSSSSKDTSSAEGLHLLQVAATRTRTDLASASGCQPVETTPPLSAQSGSRAHLELEPSSFVRTLPSPCRRRCAASSLPAHIGAAPLTNHTSLGQAEQTGPLMDHAPHSQPMFSSRCRLRLDDLIPARSPREILDIGVLPQMLVDLSEDYGLSSLCKSRHCFPLLKPAAARIITSLPLGDDSAMPEAFQIFVDGSYHADTEASAWALCILGLVNAEWQWFGFLSDALPPQLATGTSGKASAHVAEQWALLHAVAFAVSHGSPTYIGYDCISAAGQAEARFSSHPLSRLQCACISLLHICHTRQIPVHLHHIHSHQGHAGNEFVDAAAKAAATISGCRSPPVNQFLVELWNSGDLEWLWCSVADGGTLPTTTVDGKLAETPVTATTPFFTPLDFLPPPCQPHAAVPLRQWNARFCTYNALSLRALAQRECLDSQFHRDGAHVVCLQESRQPASARFHSCHYFGAASASINGQLGCQIWFHSQLPLATCASVQARWKPETLSVLHSDPRALLVTCVAGSQTYAILSAHAPTAAAGDEALLLWWANLFSIARKVPSNALLFCGIDANARFQEHARLPNIEVAEGTPARLLCQFAEGQQLACTALVDSSGAPIVTWTSPNGKPACLDFLLFPAEMGHNLVTRGAIPHFADLHPGDHAPLTADVAWTLSGSAHPRAKRLDTDRMRTDDGRRTLQHIHASTPPVPWSTDVDTHCLLITRHLQNQLEIHFPLPDRRPRQPTISNETWAWIRLRRATKRIGRRAADLLRKEVLHDFFQLWRSCERRNTVARQRRLCILMAHCQSQTIRATSAYRFQLRRDCADRARTLFFEAKGKGPEAMAHHLRTLTKAGRRYKPLPTQPCLIDQGQAAADPLLELGLHFAADEKGHLCTDFAELVTRPCPVDDALTDTLARHEVISMPQLAVSFAAIHHRKAPGLSGLPPEAFSCAAAAAANVYWPLYLKATTRQQAPLLWRGGRVVPVNKPQKALGTRAAWRSILLMEASTKAVCTAVRATLLQGFERIAQPAQGGSRKGSALQLPMAYAQLTLDYLVRTNSSGGLIFFDGKAAFYATFREVVLGRDALMTPVQIEELASQISPDAEVQDAFIAAALGPGLLADSGIPNGLRQFLASTLHQTWFLIGAQSTFVTKTGTMPGAPLADLVFQFAFAHFLERARTRLRDLELLMKVPHQEGLVNVPSPTWMDDIAVPLQAPSADLLVPRAQKLVHTVATEMAKIGIHINTGTGKSEALLHFAGQGSRKARHFWLVECNATFQVKLAADMPSQMQIVAHYNHLGSIISFDRTPQLDIRRRAAAARDARRKIHRPLLTNSFLTVEERLTMHWSLVMRKFLHGAGLWTFRLDRDFHSFSAAYLSLIRPICQPILGIPSKGLDDDMVCAICGFPSARLLRDLELIAMAPAIGSRACEALQSLLSSSTWLEEVTLAWRRVCDSHSTLPPPALLQQWLDEPR